MYDLHTLFERPHFHGRWRTWEACSRGLLFALLSVHDMALVMILMTDEKVHR
jgi:hypothetical protein